MSFEPVGRVSPKGVTRQVFDVAVGGEDVGLRFANPTYEASREPVGRVSAA